MIKAEGENKFQLRRHLEGSQEIFTLRGTKGRHRSPIREGNIHDGQSGKVRVGENRSNEAGGSLSAGMWLRGCSNPTRPGGRSLLSERESRFVKERNRGAGH